MIKQKNIMIISVTEKGQVMSFYVGLSPTVSGQRKNNVATRLGAKSNNKCNNY